MRVFTTKWFQRFARKQGIHDRELCQAVSRAEQGSIDADLGGGIIKQRVARQGGGRSGGFRTVIAYRSNERSLFMYGFAKNAQDNISRDDLKRLRRAAAEALAFHDRIVQKLITDDKWAEVCCDE